MSDWYHVSPNTLINDALAISITCDDDQSQWTVSKGDKIIEVSTTLGAAKMAAREHAEKETAK